MVAQNAGGERAWLSTYLASIKIGLDRLLLYDLELYTDEEARQLGQIDDMLWDSISMLYMYKNVDK